MPDVLERAKYTLGKKVIGVVCILPMHYFYIINYGLLNCYASITCGLLYLCVSIPGRFRESLKTKVL